MLPEPYRRKHGGMAAVSRTAPEPLRLLPAVQPRGGLATRKDRRRSYSLRPLSDDRRQSAAPRKVALCSAGSALSDGYQQPSATGFERTRAPAGCALPEPNQGRTGRARNEGDTRVRVTRACCVTKRTQTGGGTGAGPENRRNRQRRKEVDYQITQQTGASLTANARLTARGRLAICRRRREHSLRRGPYGGHQCPSA